MSELGATEADALTAAATVAGGTGEPMIVEGVEKWFGKFQALPGVDLTVGRQEVVVVIGPSGSGKSTLIRCINRLETPRPGTDRRRRHRAHQRPAQASATSAARSAWCSSSSTCSPT